MLIEPGMLLIARSADQRPWLADMLVEYLDNYARTFDPSAADEAFLSVQRALLDCERKGVLKSVRDLINIHKLKPQTQTRLKTFYRYNQLIDERQRRRSESHSYDPAAVDA